MNKLYDFLKEEGEINYYESGAYYEDQMEPYTGDHSPVYDHIVNYITDYLLSYSLEHLLITFLNQLHQEHYDTPHIHITRIPCLRAPKFDIKRTLIHQAYINNPDMTVQQFADTCKALPQFRII